MKIYGYYIIGVISLITVPVVTKVLKDTGDKIFESIPSYENSS